MAAEVEYVIVNTKTQAVVMDRLSAEEALDTVVNFFYEFAPTCAKAKEIANYINTHKEYGDFKIFERSNAGDFLSKPLPDQQKISNRINTTFVKCRRACELYSQNEVDFRLELYADKVSTYGYVQEDDIAAFIRSDIERRCEYALSIKGQDGWSDCLDEISMLEEDLSNYKEKVEVSLSQPEEDKWKKQQSSAVSFNVINKRTHLVVKRDVTEAEGRAFIVNTYYGFDTQKQHPKTQNADRVVKLTGGYRDLQLKKMLIALPTHDIPDVSVLKRMALFFRNDSQILSAINRTRGQVRKNPQDSLPIEKALAAGFLTHETVRQFMQQKACDVGEYIHYCQSQGNKPTGLNLSKTDIEFYLDCFKNSAQVMAATKLYDVADTIRNDCIAENLKFADAVDVIVQKYFPDTSVPEAKQAAMQLQSDAAYKQYCIAERGTHTYVTHEEDADPLAEAPLMEKIPDDYVEPPLTQEELNEAVPGTIANFLAEERAHPTETPAVSFNGSAPPVGGYVIPSPSAPPALDANTFLSVAEAINLTRGDIQGYTLATAARYLIQKALYLRTPTARKVSDVFADINTKDDAEKFITDLPDGVEAVVRHKNNNLYQQMGNKLDFLHFCAQSMFDAQGPLRTYTKQTYAQYPLPAIEDIDVMLGLTKPSPQAVPPTSVPTPKPVVPTVETPESPQSVVSDFAFDSGDTSNDNDSIFTEAGTDLSTIPGIPWDGTPEDLAITLVGMQTTNSKVGMVIAKLAQLQYDHEASKEERIADTIRYVRTNFGFCQ